MRLTVVGLMSGTSMDGIDAAVVEIDDAGGTVRVTAREWCTTPYSPEMRRRLSSLVDGAQGAGELALINVQLGHEYAAAVRTVCDVRNVDLLACHGQTIAHLPHHRATFQIGAPAVLAAETGLTVVSDFRMADLAVGGEGAPLVPLADWTLLCMAGSTRIALNIGGIANLTLLPAGSALSAIRAFDTGPGNAPIDAAISILSGGRDTYDVDGLAAASGSSDPALVTELLSHPFFSRMGPKSTGTEIFGRGFAELAISLGNQRDLSAPDILASITSVVARSIGSAIREVGGADEVIVSGGGWHNKTLMRFLCAEVMPIPVHSSQDFGIPVDAKEAIAFALLGFKSIRGLPSNVPSCTGASREVVLGSITPGANYRWLMERMWM